MLQLVKPGGAVSCPSYAFPPGLPLASPVGLHNIRCNYRVRRNYRAENDGVECRAFRRFVRWACPETPHRYLWQRRPETPHFRADFFDFERERGKNTHGQPQEKHTNTPPGGTKGMTNYNRERKRILLVDDEVDARELAAAILEQYTLICACNFDEGVRFAYQRYFDLYILDNWLPDGNGAELCRLIRGFDPHTPILFCSAAAYARDIREAMRAGAQEYLVKPVFPNEL
jgi:CheY-like chemotaxis protein